MRDQLFRLLGDLPSREREVSARKIAVREQPACLVEELILDVNGIEPTPAYFLAPKGVQGRAPAILYNHYHAGRYDLGKDELLMAKPESGLPSYAESLTAAGYCVLCVDMWAFGGRAHRSEMDIFKEMLWNGRVMWGMMVFDSLKALDYLESRSEVDPGRMATLGMSMGSTMAWWIAALDERVKVCVDICCLTDFQSLLESNALSEHGIYYYVPSLLKHFTTAQINEVIAPRAHLSLAGTRDPLTPVAGLDRIERELADVYGRAGKPENWKLVRYDVGHVETAGMRREAMNFLAQHL